MKKMLLLAAAMLVALPACRWPWRCGSCEEPRCETKCSSCPNDTWNDDRPVKSKRVYKKRVVTNDMNGSGY